MAVQVVFTPNSAFYLGVYVPGAKAEFYQVGTTTPITVYTDNTLGTAHAWPVVADGSGTFPAVWVSGATGVKAIIKDASGATIRTITQAALVPETSSAASGVTFGPVPTNPATDVQQAIENVQADFDGLGTMSAQNANAVTVTGGTINGANIGATTQGTGRFTTVQANNIGDRAIPVGTTTTMAAIPAASAALQLLRSNAGNTGYEWAAYTPRPLLQTQATTSGATVTFSSLSLAGYTAIEFVIDRVSFSGGAQLRIDTGNGVVLVSPSTAAGGNILGGGITLNVATGTGTMAISVHSSASPFSISTDSAFSSYIHGGSISGVTSISFSPSAGTFDAGQILLYGIV